MSKQDGTGAATVELLRASRWFGPAVGVNGVDLQLFPGSTGLLGPNGAGKSTLMKLIAGVLPPSLGEVRVQGEPVWSRARARAAVGYSPEVDAFFEEMSCREFLTAMARLSGIPAQRARERAGEVLEKVGMAAAAGKRLAACSKGMRQRVKVGQALIHDPQVLLFDEPLAGIDPGGRVDLMALFRELARAGRTVLISTHILHEVDEATDRIVLMARGRVLASGTVREIRELLDDRPLTVAIAARPARELARELIVLEEVAGVSLDGEDLVVQVRHPERFFRRLPSLVLSARAEVGRLEPLDASAEAVFHYLVGGG